MLPDCLIRASLLALLAALLASLRPTPALAEAAVKVTPTTVMPGQQVTISGSGWAPHDQILVSFTDPSGNILPLGVILADANGNFQQEVVVPRTVPAGAYRIDGNGQSGSVSVVMTIVVPTPTPAPPTPTPRPTIPPASPTSAGSPSAAPSGKAVATNTDTPTPTFTPTATFTPTETPTPTPTFTPTATPTATPTSTPTSTPTPTNTPTLPQRIVATGQSVAWPIYLVVLVLAVLGAYLFGRRSAR